MRQWPAPSSLAASSTSRLMPRKNWRRKKIANGVMKKYGATRPGNVPSRPRFLIRMKLGSAVKIGGTISAVRKTKKTMSRPGHFSRAKAYAASALKNTCPAVATTGEDDRVAQVEEEVDRGARTALGLGLRGGGQPEDPLVGAEGEVHRAERPGCRNSAFEVESEVRSIQ